MKSERTPWSAMIARAAPLGVAPAAFWALSMKEWRALTQASPPDTLTRAAFDEMARRFPDGGHDDRV